jgi:two-component system OmpR family sensor kinase
VTADMRKTPLRQTFWQSAIRRLEVMPLRFRLVAILLVLLTAALLLVTISTAYLTKRDLLGRVDAELTAVAAPVANQALDDLDNSAIGGAPTGYAFALMSTDGVPLHYVNPTGEKVPPCPRSRCRTGEFAPRNPSPWRPSPETYSGASSQAMSTTKRSSLSASPCAR